jgi:hypothetical protein
MESCSGKLRRSSGRLRDPGCRICRNGTARSCSLIDTIPPDRSLGPPGLIQAPRRKYPLRAESMDCRSMTMLLRSRSPRVRGSFTCSRTRLPSSGKQKVECGLDHGNTDSEMRRTDLENACQRLILALPQSAEPFRTLSARPRETNWHTRMPVCRLTIVIRRDAIGFRSSANRATDYRIRRSLAWRRASALRQVID